LIRIIADPNDIEDNILILSIKPTRRKPSWNASASDLS